MDTINMFDKILGLIEDAGFSVAVFLVVVFVAGYYVLVRYFFPDFFDPIIKHLPLILTVFFLFGFRDFWMRYIQIRQFIRTEYVVLELKLPEEITQSPLAMETALNAFFHTGEPGNPYEKYIDGALRPEFSLEIVSFEGDVRFFIRTRKKIQNIIEAQLYSQYPTIEIHEVPDYVPSIPYKPETMDLFGVYQKLQKPDPYPIKTYIDFGLDKETKEEFKIDPMAAILEFLGSFGVGEYGLFQVIIRSHQSEKRKPGTWFKKENWKDEAEREVEGILEKVTGGEGGFLTRLLTEGEQDLIKSLDRNTAKKPFDTGIRTIYMADKNNFRGDRRAGLPTMMRTFESHALNGFKPIFPTMFTYPWEDLFGRNLKKAKEELFEGYRWRSYISPPYNRKYFVLSAEELATVFHLPGRVVQTPTLGRVSSHKEGAPPNLPL